MTPHDIAFFAAVFCISGVIGAALGILCRGHIVRTVVFSLLVSLLFFAALEWRFGSPEEWSWQYPIASSAYLVGPFVALVAAPTALAALVVGRWWVRRQVI
jgi:hypothetical protein